MYVERFSTSPLNEGEVIFFPGQIFHPANTLNWLPSPDSIRDVRRNIMATDLAAETTPIPALEKTPRLLGQTNQALTDLYNTAVFQRNGILAGTCLRLQQETASPFQSKIDAPVIASIKAAASYQVAPKDALGQSFNNKLSYVDKISLVSALANLRQGTGSLETGNPAADQKMEEQFRFLNGQLFELNRAGGNNTVLEDLRLAVLLKEAFPEHADQIDVEDIPMSAGVMTGHAVEIAKKYLQRAVAGKLFSVPGMNHKELSINTGRTNLSQFHPTCQTDQITGFQLSLGSEALAAVGILRFFAEFDASFVQTSNFDKSVLDKAQDDLIRYRNKHPDVFQDPNLVLLFGEHLANLQTIRKKLAKPESDIRLVSKIA